MNKDLVKKNIFHLVAVLLFVVLAYSFASPVIQGKVLKAHDTVSWRCMAQETIDYNDKNEDVALWTDAMFGGMPTYQIMMEQPNNWLRFPEKIIHSFPRPVSNILLYLVCFYILLLAFGVRPLLAFAGAIGFTFASYNFIIISAGHNTKAITIAYIAPLIGAVFLAFKRKKILGSLLTALFLSLAIRANHIQILYYTLILLIVFAIVEFIYSVKDKKVASFFKTSALLIVALVVALGVNATSLWTTNEYGQSTMRGKSNGLTTKSSSQEGLNKDYITQWSYGVIPNFKGGASSGILDENSETAQQLKKMGVPNVKKMLSQMPLPLYWGTQPFTSGPVYIGAIIIFLFVLSLFLVERKLKYWLLPVILLTLMLSWGRNFMPLTDFFIDYVPLYNKFRAVSMILVITGFSVTLLAFLGLKEIFQSKRKKEEFVKPLMISFGIVGGLTLLFVLIPSLAGSFVSSQDVQLQGDYSFLRNSLPLDRKAMLRSDALRSFVFILLSVVVLFAFLKEKVKKEYAILGLALLILLDVFPVAKRYLNEDNFERKRSAQQITPTPADNFILQDKTNYRVLDLTKNIFNDATPSYFHKNIGGYHAAKLRRYQELIDMQIDGELSELKKGLQVAKTYEDMNSTFAKLGVLNMLNMKYVIVNPNSQPLVNPYANGSAWLVDKIHIAQNADNEMELLGNIDTKKELVVDNSLKELFSKTNLEQRDTTAQIELKSYSPNHLVYNFASKTEQVAVFSEIFYDKGWKAFVNGKEVSHTRVDYLLRGMVLKAGNYEVEFKFEPKAYFVGNKIALVSSILLFLSLLGYVVYAFRKKKK